LIMRKNSAVLLVSWALAVVPAVIGAAPVYAQSSFTGTYSAQTEDGLVQLTLTQESDNSLTGTLSESGSQLGLRGKVVEAGKKATGKIVLNGQEIPIDFELRWEGDKVRFTMIADGEKEELLLTPKDRSTASKPKTPSVPKPSTPTTPKTAPAKPKTTPNPVPPKPSPVPTNASLYRHPSGVKFALPQGWKIINASDALLLLLPPGQSKPDGDELYFLLISQAGEATRHDDPRIVQGVEALLNGEEGLLKGAVRFEQTKTHVNGASFEGTANNETKLYARTAIGKPNQVVAGVLAVGLKAKIQPRETALHALATSIKIDAPERDPRFLGTWGGSVNTSGLEARDNVGRSQASSVTDSSTTFSFGEDGTFVETSTSRTIAIGQGVSLDTGDNVEKTQLVWCAGNGKVCLFLPGGLSATGTYRFEGETLVVTLGNKRYVLNRQ
jgi:hypothetical protein